MTARRRSIVHKVNVAEGIVPLGKFKAQATRFLKDLDLRDHPLIITQNGKPVAVMLSPEAFEALWEQQEYLETVARGIDDADAGRVVDHKIVRNWLESWGTEDEGQPPK